MFPKPEGGRKTFRELCDGGSFDSPNRNRAPLSARLPQFIGLARSAEAIFRSLLIVIIGLGSVGRRIALHSARLQPREVRLVDHARYKPESLLTQEISPCDVGQPKALNTGLQIKSISPGTRVLVCEGRFQELQPWELQSADIVLLATDNLPVEVAVSEICLRFGIPLIHAAVQAEALVAQMRFMKNACESDPCLACLFGPQEWDHHQREMVFSCSGTSDPHTTRIPTMSTSFLCALAADLAMVQLTRYLLRLGDDVADTLLEYCGYTHRTTISPLKRNASCPCDHSVWKSVNAARPVAESSLRDLAQSAGITDGASAGERLAEVDFTVGDHDFIESGYCCSTLQPVRRFAREGKSIGRSAVCGGPLTSSRAFSRQRVPAAALGPLLQRPLKMLGADSATWVTIHHDNQTTLIH